MLSSFRLKCLLLDPTNRLGVLSTVSTSSDRFQLKVVEATCVTSVTLLGVLGKLPVRHGNCFSVQVGDAEYRIVNFNYENLQGLLKRGVTWPIKIALLSDSGRAIVHDERIPDEWYDERYYEVCCPASLLPFPQIARHARQAARGERTENDRFISVDPSKRPKLKEPAC